MRADRLLQIVTLLRAHGRLTAAALAERLEVDPRTVLRDMESLSTAGVPVYAERGRGGGFGLLPGYQPSAQVLTAAEIEALLLAPTGAAPQATMRRALAKLSTSMAPGPLSAAERAASRIVVDPAGWFGTEQEPRCWPDVQRAALGDRRVRLRYRARNAVSAADRTVDPYGLVQAGSVWYLVAAHRGRPHTFRVERIESLTVLAEPSRRPEPLDLAGLWRRLRDDFTAPPRLTIRLEVTGTRRHEVMIMLRAVGSADVVVESEAPTILRAQVLSVPAAVAALGGLGDGIRVVEPDELIAALVDNGARSARAHARR